MHTARLAGPGDAQGAPKLCVPPYRGLVRGRRDEQVRRVREVRTVRGIYANAHASTTLRVVSQEHGPEIDLLADPTYRDAVTDLLGVLAYAELVAFERLAYDARMAPTLEDKAALARLATAEFGHYQLLERHLEGMGVEAEKAMAPFVVPLEAFHAWTAPSDWAESLVKAYVGDGIAADFYREIAQLLDPLARALVLEVLADTGHAEFAVERVRQVIAADPTIAGRLALWGRRIVGEALAQAQAVCAEREALVTLLVGGVPGTNADLAELMRTFTRITDAHMARMAALGLSA